MKILSLFWGFILTKWYVNFGYKIKDKHLVISFILTKWYVNATEECLYVGKTESFILTKWYVNMNFRWNRTLINDVLY
ncbi:TPA: hypothetical protein KOC61_003899 [Clostridioides difficile]|nr:hypothetical protein [Clostridioides difficile]